MRKRKGFTLIELMIVVAIIAIIAAIAIPNLLGAKKSANEASAISSLRTLSTVCEQYRNRNGTYPATLNALATQGYIDNVLGAGVKSGYQFGSQGGGGDGNLNATADTWECYAEPSTPGTSGDRYFYIDQSGVLRSSTTGAGAGNTWNAVE